MIVAKGSRGKAEWCSPLMQWADTLRRWFCWAMVRRVACLVGSSLSRRYAVMLVLAVFTAALVLPGCGGGQQQPVAQQQAAAPSEEGEEAEEAEEPGEEGEGEEAEAPRKKKKRKKGSSKKKEESGPVGLIQPIALSPMRPVTLKPGQSATVDLQVKRNGNEGPIKIELNNVPEGVTAKASGIPAGKSTGKLQLSAAEKLGDQQLDAMLRITAIVGKNQATQLLPVTVTKLNLPVFQPASKVILQPGATVSVRVAVQRNGYEGPIKLRVEELPAKTTAKAEDIAAGQTETTLKITAAGDAPDANKTARVFTTLYTRKITVDLPIQIVRQPFRVKSFMVVHVKPGQTEPVQVPVERAGYTGPIDIKPVDVPPELKIPPVQVPAGATSAMLQISAVPNAKERVHSVQLLTSGGIAKRREDIVVRVSPSDSEVFDPQLPADPEWATLLRRGSYGGRVTARNKQILLDGYGGTAESEAAVMRGLAWLAKHQHEDGSWPLKEYHKDIEGCDCWSEFEANVDDTTTAGTAFGVLPFLGAGVAPNHAPKSPPQLAQYREVVKKGIDYLVEHQVKGTEEGAGNLGGNMYAHALGTMALCEAYGLSGERRLQVPAQMAIKYLVDSQDPKGGGWRYGRKQPGDMSVTGWVFFAIRNGQLAGLTIRSAPLEKAERFLDACAAGPEEAKLSRYGYLPGNEPRLSLTAAGLLTRQFLGWNRRHPQLVAGCKYLMQNLPPENATSLGAIYYYHYATQVLHYMGGPDFDLWNHRMREHLIRTQEKEGHKAGSWNPRGTDWGARGGRIYATAMALLTLEVYYRHLPIYGLATRTTSG